MKTKSASNSKREWKRKKDAELRAQGKKPVQIWTALPAAKVRELVEAEERKIAALERETKPIEEPLTRRTIENRLEEIRARIGKATTGDERKILHGEESRLRILLSTLP